MPAWAAQQSQTKNGQVRVLAVLTTPGPDGSERYLRDEYVIRN